jgi:hypothetical protein
MQVSTMPKRLPAAPGDDPEPADPELAEFAALEPAPPADPGFRERLRGELWNLLNEVLAAEAGGERKR